MIYSVFGVLAYGAGLYAVIMDAKDEELIRTFKILDKKSPESKIDELYLNLSEMIKNFGSLEDIKFDKNNIDEQNIIKTAAVLLNKTIYSDSFTQV